jgi:hypothetical protein
VGEQSSDAPGDKWRVLPPLTWGADFPATTSLTVTRNNVRQPVIGFGSAMTVTSAFNAISLMNDTTRQEFLEAGWGSSGLQWSINRITLNSADYRCEPGTYSN